MPTLIGRLLVGTFLVVDEIKLIEFRSCHDILLSSKVREMLNTSRLQPTIAR
jgi:hypothetical protein